MSKTPFSEVPAKDSKLKSVTLPCHPGFIYAAYQSEDGSDDATITCFHSIPNILEGFVHIMDVSLENVSDNKNVNHQRGESNFSDRNISCKNKRDDEHELKMEEKSDQDRCGLYDDDTHFVNNGNKGETERKEIKSKHTKSQLSKNDEMNIPGLWGKKKPLLTTLTSVDITKIQRKKISAQKYPCFLQKSKFQVHHFNLIVFYYIFNF